MLTQVPSPQNVKHTQTIRRMLPRNCLSEFDHFVGFVLIELKNQNLQ